jgi:spore maturation protein CgeB
MNILVIGKFYTEGFGLHIAETLEAMGHTVSRFEPGYHSGRLGPRLGHRIDQVGNVIREIADNVPVLRAWYMKELWKVASQANLDVVILTYDFLWPSEVKELKRLTTAAVTMWFPDAITNFKRAFFMNAPYDGLFFKDPFILHRMQGILASPIYYLPECFNPTKHLKDNESKRDSSEFECDIAIAGGMHSYRVAFFKHLTDYNVKIWGAREPLWLDSGPVAKMYQGRPVYNHEKATAFLAAKIVFNNLNYGEIWGINVRAFEIAGIGAFQMIDWRPGIEQLFDVGKELVCFQSIADLKQMIDYWLPRDEERREIALAGKVRALAEHTYKLRLNLLLDTLSGKENGYPLPHFNFVR